GNHLFNDLKSFSHLQFITARKLKKFSVDIKKISFTWKFIIRNRIWIRFRLRLWLRFRFRSWRFFPTSIIRIYRPLFCRNTLSGIFTSAGGFLHLSLTVGLVTGKEE